MSTTKEMLADNLKAIMYLELSKPVEETNTELVKDCVNCILKLENQPVQNAAKPKSRKRTARKLLLAAIIIIALLSTMFAVAENFEPLDHLFNEIRKRGGLVPGEMFSYGNIDAFIYEGEFYSSLEEFKKDYSEPILYPQKLPEGCTFKEIEVSPDFLDSEGVNTQFDRFAIRTDNPHCAVTINTSPSFVEKFLHDEELVYTQVGNFEVSLLDFDDVRQASFVFNNKVYIVTAPTMDDVIMMVENLAEK